MSRLLQLSVLLATLASLYKLWLQPIFLKTGLQGRVIQSVGNAACRTVPELSACEKMVPHAASGLVYLACSSPTSRAHWVPAVGQLNASFDATGDYIATYNPDSGVITRLEPPIPLSTHGLDVVASSSDPSVLYVYAVNHRKPQNPHTAASVGADSTLEIFETSVGGTKLTHLHTFHDPVIITPNDVVGLPDGQSFFFTNDHASKTSPTRFLSLLGLESGSVGYCNLAQGCKIVADSVHGANGIVKAPGNDTVYVANSVLGDITVFERQQDNALLKTHTIPTDRGLDNLSIDTDGVVWAAGIPFCSSILAHIADPSVLSPASAHSVAQNTGPGSFYGEKYIVSKVFEDDGKIATGTTTVVHDPKRRLLFLHGIAAPHLTVCKV